MYCESNRIQSNQLSDWRKARSADDVIQEPAQSVTIRSSPAQPSPVRRANMRRWMRAIAIWLDIWPWLLFSSPFDPVWLVDWLWAFPSSYLLLSCSSVLYRRGWTTQPGESLTGQAGVALWQDGLPLDVLTDLMDSENAERRETRLILDPFHLPTTHVDGVVDDWAEVTMASHCCYHHYRCCYYLGCRCHHWGHQRPWHGD